MFPIIIKGLFALPEIIRGVERIFGPRKGPEKKQAALTIVDAVIGALPAQPPFDRWDRDRVRAGISKIIDGAVDVLNGVGEFTHGG